jgi:hypothetical protein
MSPVTLELDVRFVGVEQDGFGDGTGTIAGV